MPSTIGSGMGGLHPSPLSKYMVAPHDTIFSIAKDFQISPQDLLKANPQVNQHSRALVMGMLLEIPLPPELGKKFYVVRAHDTLAGIAAQLQVSETDLLSANPSINHNSRALVVGQALRIPDALATSDDHPAWLKVAEAEARTGGRGAPFYCNGAGLGGDNWCSVFVNWVMRQVHLEGTHNAAAMSWLNWGHGLSAPRPGAIAILSDGKMHESGWEGIPWFHVTIFKSGSAHRFCGIGGNQSGGRGYPHVCESDFGPPLLVEARFRWPSKNVKS